MKLSSVSHTRELDQRGEGGLSVIFSLMLIIGLGWFIWHYFIRPDYSKPWWNGIATQEICLIGGQNCYNLAVWSSGEEVTRVDFQNGGYITLYNTVCDKAATWDGRWCTVNDDEGRTWEVRYYNK